MKWLSDQTLSSLLASIGQPDFSGTRYRLLEPLGRGGMGLVWLAEDVLLGRRVALKVLDAAAEGRDAEARLAREARILARLEHPGIVPVHDVGTLPDGRIYYAMKYVQGLRLDRYAAGRPPLPDRLRVFQRICESVAFAHSQGILHRDLKPANIMVGSYGEVLVMDWGVARAAPENFLQPGGSGRVEPGPGAEPVPDGPTAHGAVLGTPGYMAPEQARGENERVDERADVYALGALLRFLLYHGAPAGDADHLPVSRTTHLLRALSGSPDRIPRQLDAIWRMAASPDPARRYDGAMLMSADVVRFMDGMPVAALPETVLDRAVRLFVRHRTAVLLLLTYLAIRMLLIFFGRP